MSAVATPPDAVSRLPDDTYRRLAERRPAGFSQRWLKEILRGRYPPLTGYSRELTEVVKACLTLVRAGSGRGAGRGKRGCVNMGFDEVQGKVVASTSNGFV